MHQNWRRTTIIYRLQEYAIATLGKDIYEHFRKQWCRSLSVLPSNIIKRIPVRLPYINNYFEDKFQGVPEAGYNKLINVPLSGISASISQTVDFQESIFNINSITNGAQGIVNAFTGGSAITITGAGANGHAYTVEGYEDGKFTFLDTTTGISKIVPNTATEMAKYVNPKEITGINEKVFGSSGSWLSTEQTSVAPPSTGGAGTGH